MGARGKSRDIKKPTIQSPYLTFAKKDQLKVLKLIHRISDAFVNDVIDISDRCRSTFDVSVFLILYLKWIVSVIFSFYFIVMNFTIERQRVL